MAKASNANAQLGLIKEVVPGTTPATPSLVAQRFSTYDPQLQRGALDDDSKTGRREKIAVTTGNNSISASLGGNLAYDNFDSLFESLMFNTFTADALKIGNTVQSLTIEEHQMDIAQYRVLRGAMVNTVTMSTTTENYTTVSFDMLAMSLSGFSNGSVDANGYSAQPATDAFFHCEGEVEEGGVVLGIVTSIDISMTNNLTANYVIGKCDADDISPGMIDITGTLNVNLVDNSLVNKFMSGSYSSLKLTLADAAGNSMSFYLPKIKYTAANVPIESGSGLRTLSLPFTAVFDPTEGSGLVITRDPA